MKEVRQCPICDWKHESEPLRASKILHDQFAPGVLTRHLLREHAHALDIVLQNHMHKHSTLDWVRATCGLHARNDQLRRALHGLVSNRFNEDAAEIEALYDAAHAALRAVPNAGDGRAD